MAKFSKMLFGQHAVLAVLTKILFYITWAAQKLLQLLTFVQPKAIIALLSLLYENTNSVAMIKHVMTISKEVIE